MSARSRSSPWFRAPRTMQAAMDAIEPPRAPSPPAEDYLKHDLPPHCDSPGCCVGVLVARCRRCGFVAFVNGRCPAAEDIKVAFDQFIITIGPPALIDARRL